MTDARQDFPFTTVVAELHRFLEGQGIVYAVIGGVAVARAGAFRTTGDIDILVRREEWRRLEKQGGTAFRIGPDWAVHRESTVPVDVLFSGDDWELPFLMPDPGEVREWDEKGGVWFMAPARLLELKAAVYLSKKNEYGPSTASKDLADVTALLEYRPELGRPEALELLHHSVRKTVRQAVGELENYRPKRPKRE